MEQYNAATMNPSDLVQRSRQQTQKGDLEGAVETLRELAGVVSSPTIHATMGGLLRDLCDIDGALAAYSHAHKLSGDDAYKLRAALTMPPIMTSTEAIEATRARMEASLLALLGENIRIDDPVRMIPHLAFYLAYHGENDHDLQKLIAQVIRKACPSLQFTAPHIQNWTGCGDRKVEVVFVSSHLKNHTIGRLNRELIRLLDRSRYRVTVAFVGEPRDSFAKEIAASADSVVVLSRNIGEAQSTISGLQCDLLYYTDIGMDPFTWLLAHARLAPVQCVTWGHSMTTGLDTLDCWISGKDTEVDSGQAHYTEPLVRLTDPTVTYRRPVLEGPLPSRRALGMPSEGTIYLCPQTTFKLHPDFDPVMGEILRRDPTGHIVLPSPRVPSWKSILFERMRHHFDVNRLVWLPSAPHQQFLATLAAADVLIDPIIYGGCNTSLEALAMRTPIVTLPSPFLRDRYTAAWYQCVGVTDCIVETKEEYVDLAIRLGQDPGLRESIMDRVAANDHLLFDNPRAVREHESLFERLLADKS